MPNMVIPGATGTVRAADPANYIMIVNRDSNDIGFMDIVSHQMVGSVFLGNNVNPHMAMMSHDGRYVVTGGTRANKAYIIDVPTMTLLKEIPVRLRSGALGVHAGRPLLLSRQPRWRFDLRDRHGVDDRDQADTGLVMPLNITFSPDGTKAYIGNYGAHWVGVIDVTRHELAKRIQIAAVPGVARLDPNRVSR